MTISGPAVVAFAFFLATAERQGVDPAILDGTLQTDIFKEYIAQKEWIFPPRPHLRLIGDLIEYCATHVPPSGTRSACPATTSARRGDGRGGARVHARRRFAYVELGVQRGLDVDAFATGLSFFFNAHIDFFEEIAKLRAARRIWARWLRDRLRRRRLPSRCGCASTRRRRASPSRLSSR